MSSQLKRIALWFGFEGDDRLEKMPWQALDFRRVQMLYNVFIEMEAAPNTRDTVLSALRGVARQAHLADLIDERDWSKIREIRRAKGSRKLSGRAVSDNEVAAILSCCSDGTLSGIRDKAILALLWGCGLRRGTLVRLTLKSIDFTYREIKVISKGDKEIEISIPDSVMPVLEVWMDNRGWAPGFIFLAIDRWGNLVPSETPISGQAIFDVVKKRITCAGVKNCSPHDFRRSYITGIITRSGDLSLAQKMAGHANVTTTAGYDRRKNEAMREAANAIILPEVDDNV